MIVSVVLGEYENVAKIKLLIKVKLKGSLETVHVPSTYINAILL
jgi:hypothetical protein